MRQVNESASPPEADEFWQFEGENVASPDTKIVRNQHPPLGCNLSYYLENHALSVIFGARSVWFFCIASPQGAGGGTRARDRRVPGDLRADSLATVPPTPLYRIS
ncbi:hypothetical protein PoB_002020800 [Plakobranchus ocellatus]|uniref:Uncharacterized protein n=1 Tax=Plakobranchus ocellatus TaxID=259542 RepID=A0AAV3ZGI1_9GAST|nr:hypothetical protein PoB_002020800 [Plakobranchus ocellatus]